MYEWAGGQEALRRLTEVFYDRVLEDPMLAPVFAHMSDKHREHVALWLGEVFGGPKPATPRSSAAIPRCSATTSASG